MKNVIVLVIFATFLMSVYTVGAQTSEAANSQISPVAKEYLEKALDIMQKNSLHKKEVDWVSLRRKTLEKAAGAEETVDTWEAIRFALKSIDNHSFLQLSTKELFDREEARRKVKSETKPEEKVDTALLSPYRTRRQPEGFIHKVGNCSVPRVVVPLKFFGEIAVMNVYANALHKIIAEADALKPCGWIIDLRGNGGGAVFPMLAGVEALIEEGDAAFAVDADGGRTAFFYKDGQSGVREPNGKETILSKIEGTPYRIKKQMPVAVLIDRGTGSSGETMAVVFRGRANTRFFGERTAGMSTSTQGFKLSDGANLVLTTAVSVDRTGKAYPSGILPDEIIQVGDKVLPPTEDPVIHAALGWLGEQLFLSQPVINPSLREELLERFKKDQEIRIEVSKKVRNGGVIPQSDNERWEKVDTENTARMKELIGKYGWLGKSMVGEDGAHAAWTLIQHADEDPKFQQKCLKLMQEAVKAKEASGKDFAYLTDRVLVRDGKPQIYGTQMRFINGNFGPAPIEDEANVDKRRASVGLGPLAEYLERMKGDKY